MSRLPFEAFLALRYLRPRRTFVSVITVISIIGVMLGVAVLIVVISVMSGFDREWRSRILGFNAHLKVLQADPLTGRHTPLRDFHKVMAVVRQNSLVMGVAPFVATQVLLETQPAEGSPDWRAPILRGVDPETEGSVSVLPESVRQGEFDLEANGLLVGREFADELGLYVGDRVAIYSPATIHKMKQARETDEEIAVLPDEYIITGVFDVGFSEYNASIVAASIENAQDLYDLEENEAHGLQVMLRDPFQASLARVQLLSALGRNFYIVTWPEENPQLFDALAVEKNMMFFLLFFIMIVAGFGIVNSQITFVVQKTREIGILKALGATNPQVLWLFLSQSIVVGILGVGLGLGTGLLALAYRNDFMAFMRRATGFELLPAEIYQIYELPAAIEVADISIICGAAFITCVLAGLFPARKASRMQPVEALRYE